ncbi:hypothetical protein M378DRAFT_199975 [Amanita muscaria Koide BX008]|uniref:Uncharacterized protein n=1 Tax=Amanita muscaria (strain Koide BX008) TaxID=946122 RepID=A0A0C2WT60_AMAMK|nr:hypothetical protein M378DRAFT_199975 [Amanita muscaria Koide BX008]
MGTEPLVTNDLVQSAELRVRAVEAAHATALFAPVNLLNMFQNVSDRLDTIATTCDNNRIVSRNAHRRSPQPYIPLKKTNPGHGLALAQVVAHNIAVRNGLHAPAQPLALGSTPPHFNPNLPTYNHDTIYQLIIFYNDDFGILPGDTLSSRVENIIYLQVLSNSIYLFILVVSLRYYSLPTLPRRVSLKFQRARAESLNIVDPEKLVSDDKQYKYLVKRFNFKVVLSTFACSFWYRCQSGFRDRQSPQKGQKGQSSTHEAVRIESAISN